jgi:hypothetical protein
MGRALKTASKGKSQQSKQRPNSPVREEAKLESKPISMHGEVITTTDISISYGKIEEFRYKKGDAQTT